MKLQFVKMNPSGNITILVTDPVAREDHLPTARLLMSPEFLSAEQVGFVEKPDDPRADARLQMMGGEFCGNAARALAALLAEQTGEATAHQTRTGVTLEVSGSEKLLSATVRPAGKDGWWTELAVPVPRSLRREDVILQGEKVSLYRVTLPGIEHLILEGITPSIDVYNEILKSGFFAADAEARGIMFYDAAGETMTPLVAVGEDAPVWEGSCGSGSVALAAALAAGRGTSLHDLQIRQPQGELAVDVEWDGGKVTEARIKGLVERIATGTVCVPVAAKPSITSRSR